MSGTFEIWTVMANNHGSVVALKTFQATRKTAEVEMAEWSDEFPAAVLLLRNHGRTVAAYKAGKAVPTDSVPPPYYPRPVNVQFALPHEIYGEVLKVANGNDLKVRDVLRRSVALGVRFIEHQEIAEVHARDWNTDGDVKADKLTGGAR